jgi:dihydrofolate reductase
MKSSVYIATTLDGFIATSDGSISFLEEFQNTSPQDGDLGFASFLSTVDLLIMGRKTWDQVVSFGEDAWPYGPRSVWIWSRNPREFVIPTCRLDQAMAHDLSPREMMQMAKDGGYEHVYIDGGSTIQKFQRAGCIDEYILSLLPILLGGGISLFGNGEGGSFEKLEHLGTKSFSNGIVQSHYRVQR